VVHSVGRNDVEPHRRRATAVGGLLLVSLLSSPNINVLGLLFGDVWHHPGSVVGLALALLFGFSGQLFSRLAISAASQLGGPKQE
jgi:hypothetical protein